MQGCWQRPAVWHLSLLHYSPPSSALFPVRLQLHPIALHFPLRCNSSQPPPPQPFPKASDERGWMDSIGLLRNEITTTGASEWGRWSVWGPLQRGPIFRCHSSRPSISLVNLPPACPSPCPFESLIPPVFLRLLPDFGPIGLTKDNPIDGQSFRLFIWVE